jgi:DNA-binding NarL/FixJ family response regulator
MVSDMVQGHSAVSLQEGKRTMATHVLVADQERAFADVLAARIDEEDDIDVTGAVRVPAPGPSLLTGECADVMLLDGDLPDDVATRLCEEVSSGDKPIRVIMLSFSSEPERIVKALRARAVAWVRKDESLEHLLHVIRGVARGECWLPPGEMANVLQLLIWDQDRTNRNKLLLNKLTERERAVLACLAQGAAHRDAVAKQLHLSVHTVRTHMCNLMGKLGVHSMLEAVALTREDPAWLDEDGHASF